MDKWDHRFMTIAREISTWSRHPSIKVGCIVVDSDHNQLSGGYNGLPRGVDDSRILNQDQSRSTSSTVHAEANAVAAAARNGHSIKHSTAYITHAPCSQCAALLIQAGVKRIVYADSSSIALSSRWTDSFIEASSVLAEANVQLELYS